MAVHSARQAQRKDAVLYAARGCWGWPLDDEAVEIARRNLDPEAGDARGLLAEIHDMVYGLLGPRPYLNSLSCQATQELCLQLSVPKRPFGGMAYRHLLIFWRGFATWGFVGTANYLFGPQNPMAEQPELEDAFWAFDHGVGGFIVGVLPSLTRTRGPGCLSMGTLNDKCATLLAVFRESLRIGSENLSDRLSKEDASLADRYLHKKGSVIQVRGRGVIHTDKLIWGDDVDDFNPQRFLTSKASSGSIHTAAFRGFGGGKTLCPGRHFATNEILLLLL
ncbi:Bifunctional P450/NADPH-P450 reductase [Tolypocladium paradoxum]|uniref:Bifunctional P450/NADPH-P450 reductase n=1 Tax=Tolypocladium paradoxum TaxID=94208 RepID=A0A2S4L780_9HYPO|nr:Bifunctional P450/NADPH-P450 reductase [Tolypocladium paradoxum]